MAIDILIGDKPKWNASDYSVAEDSTPIDPTDTTGGSGQINVSVPDANDAWTYRKQELKLSDRAQGTTVGLVRTLGGSDGIAQLVADSRMTALNVTRTAQPYVGTLEGLFRYYLGLVGLTRDIVVDASIASRSVTVRGWSGIVWDKVKSLCASQQVETSLVSDQIVLRPLRGRIAQNGRDSQQSWSIDDSNMAQRVDANYYVSELRADLAYPLGGWNSKVEPYSVDAGATVTYDISLAPDLSDEANPNPYGVSLQSIDQPVCVASVTPTYSASSVYTVAGNDGLPISPEQWLADGGSVTVAINDDTESLTLTIRGGNSSKYAPYTIGMPSGDNTFYSSLRMRGQGVFYERKSFSLLTGNGADEAPTELGATVDTEFLADYQSAFHSALWTLASWTGPRRSIQVQTTGINRADDTGSLAYRTMGEFNQDLDFLGKSAAQFNAAYAGLTVEAFNELQAPKWNTRFDSQAFGNVAGARVYFRHGWHRIRSVSSITPSAVSYSADADDTIGDFNTAYAGMTAAGFNAVMAGARAGDFNVQPMTEQPDAPLPASLVPSTSLFPAPTLLPASI